MDVKEIITFFVGILVVFYVLSAFISPVETGVSNLQGALDESVTGEVLGTADANGNLTAYADHIIESGSETVYANGTASGSWANCTASVTYSTGKVDVIATATPNSCQNAQITIDYTRADAYGKDVKSLPKVGYIVALISVFAGLIYAWWGRR